MVNDFYSYTQEVDEDDIVSYSFRTGASIYYVYFDPYQYASYVEKYPNLLTLGFGFGFNRINTNSLSTSTRDHKIGVTISKIVFDFIQERGDKVVLLYHCDFQDEKQKGRDRIFNEWYESSEIKDNIFKQRLHITVEYEDRTSDLFMGYLTSAKNENKDAVDCEFMTFGQNLASSKP